MMPYTKGETNFVKYVLTHPCGTDWFLFVECFAEASLFLALGLTIPSLQDILSDESRGLLAGRAAKGHRFSAGELYEDGKQLTPTAKRVYKFAKGAAWVLEGLEFIGFWWSIVAGLDEFFYLWHSLLVERKWCSAAASTGLFHRRTNSEPVNFNATVNTLNLSILVSNRAGWSSTPFGVTLPPGAYQAIFMATFSPGSAGELAGCQIVLQIPDPLGDQQIFSEEFTIPEVGDISVFVRSGTILIPSGFGGIEWGIYNATHAIGLANCDKAEVFVYRHYVF